MNKWIMIAIGGALGAMSRFWVSGVAHRFAGDGFPYGTLAANSLGCFLIGLFSILLEKRFHWGPTGKMFIMVGFIGAFTTFSSFALESWELANAGETMKTFLNVMASLFMGFTSLFGGMFLGKMVS